MHSILSNKTNRPQVDASIPPRTSLGRRNGTKVAMKHSPDGYFAHDETFMRTWRPLSLPDVASIRNRSKTHGGNLHLDPGGLQDVQEEEDTANPHAWRRPSRTDLRGPCPALNVAANHGYLPRDGRGIGVWACVLTLRECYGGSWPYAIALTVVSFIILRLGGVGKGWLNPTINLDELAAHGVLEHDGSLTHADVGDSDSDSSSSHESFSPSHSRSTSAASSTAFSTSTTAPIRSMLLSLIRRLIPLSILTRFAPSSLLPQRFPFTLLTGKPTTPHVYAPSRPSRSLVRALLADSASGTHVTLSDIARARVRREATSRPITSHLISQFADGEFAMTLDILGRGDGKVEVEVLRQWLEEERLPTGWKPSHEQTLWRTHMSTTRLQGLMAGLRKYKQKSRPVKSVVYE